MIHYVTTEDLHIAYFEQGNKADPSILLLHGWPDDATAWSAVMPKLVQKGYRVIAPWYRGFGTTNFLKKDTPRTGNSGIIAHDTIEFMNNLGIKNFSVVGHDWGSSVAEYLAVGWPERIEQIVFLCYKPRLGGISTPSFKQARLQWHHWFMATKRGKEAVRKDPIGFARIMWETWAPKDWFDEQTFQQVAQSWLNPDFVDVKDGT
jgi:pimeloyl-ACP methyl ester carboxylesterase